jgi:hypothetical protein
MNDTPKANGLEDGIPRENGYDDGSIFNRVRTEGFKRKLEGMLKDGVLKNIVSELKLPKELVAHLMSQIDETKHAAVGVISREVRKFLENTDLSAELEKLLAKFSFEVKTTVRFVPKNESKPARVQRKPGPRNKPEGD